MDLKEGINEVRFEFIGNLNLKYTFTSRIFYYPYKPYRRIIISDIDGTITKSDVLGHIMPFINQDWSHEGIAKFFTDLYERGYIIVYLTARNIGTAQKTKDYIKSIKQGKFQLPPGPILTSPDSLYNAIKREMIIKNPETFKIKVLRTIKEVFQNSEYNPLFAGFGNKDTDAISYSQVGIPNDQIYTITPTGEIFQIKFNYKYSYERLNEMIDEYFPEFDEEKLES